uniref:Uncharacterized protein n=1 Tax=Panagrellus redivivus TaxID=6233 RepID=A0A7E4ZW76_PANRE
MAVAFEICFGVAGACWTLLSAVVLILCTKRKPSHKSHKHTHHDDGNRLTDSAVKLELEAAMKSSNNLGSKPSALSRESKESNSNFNASNDLDADPPISVCKPISMGMSQGGSTPSHHRKENAAVSPGPPVSQYVAPTTASSGDGNKMMVSQYIARKDPSVRAKKDMATARAKKDMETARAKKDVESAKAKKDAKSAKGKKCSAETVTKTKSKSH